MSDALIIGIDAGTSVVKSVAFSSTANRSRRQHFPTSMSPFQAVAPNKTWRAPGEIRPKPCAFSARKLPSLADRVLAIAVTGQGDGMWLIDKAGEPVAPAWLWLDGRAASIAEDICALARTCGAL